MKATKEAEFAEMKANKEAEFAEMKETKETEFAEMKAAKEAEFEEMKTTKEAEFAEMKATKEAEYADLEAAKAAVEEEKRLGEEAAAAAAAKAADEIAELTEAKTGLEEVKANNEAEIATLKGNVADLEEAKAGLEQVKADNETEIASLQEKIATLEGEKQKLEEDLETARQEITSLNETLVQKNNEIESLQESLRAAEEQIASLQQTVEERNAEIEDLHGKLKAESERAENAEAHGRDLQARLDDTEQNLHVTSGKLADLEQYRIVLHSENDDIYVTVLDKIWTTIVTLVEGTFRPDIDDMILNDPSCWTNLRNSPYLKHATQLQIPLPQSNTPAAKGMRISAVLAVLSRAMHKHLFRPVYLLDDDDENLVKFLRALEDEDPTREAHMRSTLISMMPERQMEQGARRVKMVVREVSWLVQHLLSALQFEAFCSGLEAACKLACEQWMRIQLAQMKIEPYFGPPYDDFDWQVLELPEFAEAAEGGRDGRHTDEPDDIMDDRLETVEATGTPSEIAGAADAADSFHASEHSHMDDMMEGDVDPDEILLVVWPSMCCVENGELMSMTQGLVISKEQARPALEEQRSRSRLIPRPGSRRARTMSMPGGGHQSRGSSPRGKPAHFLSHAMAASEISGPDDN
ncbi:Myosin heavy chain, skeletal muscle, adult [Madurella mycetomatis]|uniref:Myosin heavy chain, skeletal muscle, adult n=1 Tax=Madurella mycetomatis TaxID=100816 RepID=A0A175WAQ4_9PEZI|nr:Myosin heavy chain, skeletal muscle, adult [Madurella mycetomatis]